jgi:hypothetical protein
MTNRYAIIENGVVANIASADAEFAAQQGWVECPDRIEDGTSISAGFLYENGVFSLPPRNMIAEWNAIKEIRNYALLASDVNVLPDRWAAMTTEQQTAWSTYRQALRDIPTTFSDPADVVWPVAP